MPSQVDRLRDQLIRRVYRLGWWGASRIPDPLIAAVTSGLSRIGVRHHGRHVATLRHNLAVLTGTPTDDDRLRRGVQSYLRTFAEVLALPGWSRADVLRRVRTSNEEVLRTAYAGPGAVVALPHSANWDLAGAWACLTGMPVTTVAEELPGAAYADFVAFRERLGMEVISHRSPHAIADLVAAVRRGRLICLLADRDLGGTGVPVTWSGRSITMPGGPALVARRSGAALIPAVCRYEGATMVIDFGPVVEHRPGRTGLTEMTQQVADFFSATLRRHPDDWHLLQPFFPETR